MTGEDKRGRDPRPPLMRLGPSWSLEHRRGEPERPGFNAWDERVRMRQNIAGAIVVTLLGIATYVVIDQFAASSRTMACIEAGHRYCGGERISGNGHR